MGKAEASERKKVSKEKKRVSQDVQAVPDNSADNVKKVTELTFCSEKDAVLALADHKNDIDGAVLAVLERVENGDSWKEGKIRKQKKQDANDKEKSHEPGHREQVASKGNAARDLNAPIRPASGANPRNVRQSQGQEPHKDRLQQGDRRNFVPRQNQGQEPSKDRFQQGDRRNFTPRDNRSGKFVQKNSADSGQNFPSVPIAELMQKEEESNWKDGPLIFEQTVPSSQPPVVPPKSDKPTFAEIAANRKVIQPVPMPPLPSLPQIAHSQQEMEAEDNASIIMVSSPLHSLNEALHVSDSFGPAATSNLSVNQEFTDKLKSDIGLNSSADEHFPDDSCVKYASVAVQADNALQGGSLSRVNAGLQFGFHSGTSVSVDSRPPRMLSMVNHCAVNIPPNEAVSQRFSQQQDSQSGRNQPQVQQFDPQQMQLFLAQLQSCGYQLQVPTPRDNDRPSNYTSSGQPQYAQVPGNRAEMNSMTPMTMAASQTNMQNMASQQQLHRTSAMDNRTAAALSNGVPNAQYQMGQGAYQLRQGNMDAVASGPGTVIAPPPGFSSNPYLTQPNLQSMFQLPPGQQPLSFPIESYMQTSANHGRQPQMNRQIEEPGMRHQHLNGGFPNGGMRPALSTGYQPGYGMGVSQQLPQNTTNGAYDNGYMQGAYAPR